MNRRPLRKQMRGFVVAWTSITMLVAGATFFAIYLTYDPGGETTVFAQNIAFPSPTQPQQSVVVESTVPPTIAPPASPTSAPLEQPTDLPIEEPQESDTVESAPVDPPTEESVAVAQANPQPEPTIPPIQDTSFQPGIQVQVPPDLNQQNQDGWIRDVSDNLGLEWFKQQVRWEFIEEEEGDRRWRPLRVGIRSAREYDMKMMVSVVTAPDWARESGVDLSKHGPPADIQAYVDFVTDMVERFGDDIHAIEVWNEQNLDREWTSTRGLVAADYVELLRRTYEAVKAINPDIIIISGALAPSGGWTEPDGRVSAIDDFTYFDAMIEAGLLNYADCVGAHHNGYNIGPSVRWDAVENDPTASFRGPFDNPHHSWSFRSTLETYANRIQLAGGDQKLCVTEFGWASTEDLDGSPAGFGFADDNTLEEQATWTIEALNLMESWDTVWLAFIWNFNYAPQAGWNPSNDNVPYSLIGPDWAHRPVYDAVAEWSDSR